MRKKMQFFFVADMKAGFHFFNLEIIPEIFVAEIAWNISKVLSRLGLL